MKIAILTSARSGSTSLFHLIEKHLAPKRYFSVSEPYNSGWRDRAKLKTYDIDSFNTQSKLFIKTFVSDLQRPKTFKDDEEGYWKWFFNYFDKVILLDRVNKDLQSESLTYHLKKNEIYSWQKKQYYDLDNIKNEEIENTKDILIRESNKLHNFSKNGYPLVYFEDIFIEKNKQKLEELFKYLNLLLDDELYEKYVLSDTYKIRIEKKENQYRSLI